MKRLISDHAQCPFVVLDDSSNIIEEFIDFCQLYRHVLDPFMPHDIARIAQQHAAFAADYSDELPYNTDLDEHFQEEPIIRFIIDENHYNGLQQASFQAFERAAQGLLAHLKTLGKNIAQAFQGIWTPEFLHYCCAEPVSHRAFFNYYPKLDKRGQYLQHYKHKDLSLFSLLLVEPGSTLQYWDARQYHWMDFSPKQPSLVFHWGRYVEPLTSVEDGSLVRGALHRLVRKDSDVPARDRVSITLFYQIPRFRPWAHALLPQQPRHCGVKMENLDEFLKYTVYENYLERQFSSGVLSN